VINYPTLNKKETYEFNKQDYEDVEKVLGEITSIMALEKPPQKWSEPKKICMSCAYYEFCYI
jgi:CRISPR/Cas system-associated exonuclease Cas4 (RecB family)